MKYLTYKKLFLSVIVFALAVFSVSCKQEGVSQPTTSDTKVSSSGDPINNGSLPIAYINVDSLLMNYQFAKDINDKLTKKMEDNRLTIAQKTKRLEADQADFQKKYENNAFLSADNATQAYNRLQKQGQELNALMERMQNEWLMEQNKVNMQLADSTRKAIELINSDGKYEIVFNMRELDNILYAKPKYDITKEVTNLLNSRYQPDSNSK